MVYRAFYREWRPQSFAEVVGQEHIVRTLQNALKSGQIGHAYLFSGPRGTGKTSVAKIFAKTVNCLNGPDIEPCNGCANCQRITEGSFVDVLEIDAASNRGIDEIRDLKEKVRYLPAEGKYKVYIIDEVHMLTTEAFNALLKTLEEPPAHVIFLLATTEPQRLPATILSRCQRFDFRRLSVKEIAERLRKVADTHNISTNDSALMLISRYAEGALRDALGLLEQAASFGNQIVKESDVLAILGVIGEDIAFQVAEALLQEDGGELIRIVNDVVNSGKDPKEFLSALILHFRSLMVVKSLPDPGDLVGMTENSIVKAKAQAEKFSEDRILQIIDFLAKVENEIRWAALPRVTVETTLLRLIGMGPALQASELNERIMQLEKDIVRLKMRRTHYGSLDEKSIMEASQKDEHESAFQYPEKVDDDHVQLEEEPLAMQIDDPEDDPLTLTTIKALWPQALENVKKRSRMLHSFLTEGLPKAYEPGKIVLGFKFNIHKEQIEKRENRLIVEEVLEGLFKEKLAVVCRLDDEETKARGKSSQSTSNGDEPGETGSMAVDDTLDLFGGKIIDF